VVAAASPSLTSYRIEFNVGNGERAKTPLGQNAKVRQAFDAAIDHAVINQVVFDGQYIPGNQSVPPGNRFYIKSLPVPPRDLPRAKALMKEAGIDRLKVRMTVPNTNDYVQPAQVIQAMVAEAGFDLEINVAEVATALKESVAGEFQAFLILWSGRTDIDSNLYIFNACDGSLKADKYCNKEVDRWLDEGRTHNDLATRYAAYEKAMSLLLSDLPTVYLFHPMLIYAMKDSLEGFTPVPDGMIRLAGMRRLR
jgi:peptide/nickel transport system substrate-binding protein